jgi:hypothetical protein
VGKRRFGLMRCAMSLMNGARLAVAAQAVGIAEAAYREAKRYASERIQFGKSIDGLPAVSRILVSMRGEIEAARALIFETAVWVDTLKACEQRQEELEKEGKGSDPELIARKKRASNLADILTPMSKYYATEMGNRVCYKAMQVHGGVGYMREFNAERHFRDVRITNIYEGTSQLQVVAAIGKMVGRGLDGLLDALVAAPVPVGLEGTAAKLAELVALFKNCCDKLHAAEREVVDFFGVDLVEMAAVVVNTTLLVRDARQASTSGDAAQAAHKIELARAYASEHLPSAEAAGSVIATLDMTAWTSKTAILA